MADRNTPPRAYRSAVRAGAAEQTRRRIVEAASATLRTEGARGFSLESVAKAAGVTRLTVYNQFGSRRALLEAVFDARAAEGGLNRIREAMAEPDPGQALGRLVEVFCGFWGSDRETLAGLYAAGSGDPEFQESLHERNERRRRAIATLVGRMVERGETAEAAAADLTDLLFVLTGFAVFAGLQPGREPAAVCALIQAAVADAVRRAGRSPPLIPARLPPG